MFVLYSVSLCCFLYCVCVCVCVCANVYCTVLLPEVLNPNAVNKIYQCQYQFLAIHTLQQWVAFSNTCLTLSSMVQLSYIPQEQLTSALS